jgi:hypothetical protein
MMRMDISSFRDPTCRACERQLAALAGMWGRKRRFDIQTEVLSRRDFGLGASRRMRVEPL